jgi:hypothetical protein
MVLLFKQFNVINKTIVANVRSLKWRRSCRRTREGEFLETPREVARLLSYCWYQADAEVRNDLDVAGGHVRWCDLRPVDIALPQARHRTQPRLYRHRCRNWRGGVRAVEGGRTVHSGRPGRVAHADQHCHGAAALRRRHRADARGRWLR